jgi:hypothetical protein
MVKEPFVHLPMGYGSQTQDDSCYWKTLSEALIQALELEALAAESPSDYGKRVPGYSGGTGLNNRTKRQPRGEDIRKEVLHESDEEENHRR